MDGEEDEVYAERIQTAIADNMRISKTKFTYSDKVSGTARCQFFSRLFSNEKF